MSKNTSEAKKTATKNNIDWMITLVPLAIIAALSLLFVFFASQSNDVLNRIRFVLGDTLGVFYLAAGLGIFALSLFAACSRYAAISSQFSISS